MKKITTILLVFFMTFGLQAQVLKPEAFDLLNLDTKGLEQVKTYYEAEDFENAAASLLEYYRTRDNVVHPEVDLSKVKISEQDQKWADDGLKHIFFVHYGYQPSYFYGDDINWEHWPVQDNELRWQLHRHKWWAPMGRAYQVSKDEKYAKEWAHQYMDWIKKNPLVKMTKQERSTASSGELESLDNVRFAWRPLEVSHRIQDQTAQFMYFVESPHFTPEFLTEFIVNYHRHGEHIMGNFSDKGNHLLFEAQRMVYAGTFFPEYKNAEKWRKKGISILNEEISNQVYDDGFQFELDPHYHLAAINIFYKGILIADVNGFKHEFPQSYLDMVEKMIMATVNYSFPNYQNPCFSDAKLDKKPQMLRNYRNWAKVFPNNKVIEYMATDGKRGQLPTHLSNALKTSGYYTFRNGWKEDATVMVVKAGPPAFWHNQPDNGTFELYINGRNFFPDAGSYVYSGDKEVQKERDWFRQTMVHKTLTLDNQNLEETDSKLLLWDISNPNIEKFVTENPSYNGLKHRRAIFFVDKIFFVIVDEAHGNAKGDVAIHYQLGEGGAEMNAKNFVVNTHFNDGNNVAVQAFGPKGMTLEEEEGWVSYAYRQKAERPAFAYKVNKSDNKPVRFITVIMPMETEAPKMKAKFVSKTMQDNEVKLNLKVGKKNYDLQANW